MRHLALALFVLIASPLAKADLLLEPYLGYEFGSQTLNYRSGSNNNGKMTGAVLGGRIGYQSPVMFWAAADVSYMGGGKYKPDDSTNSDMDASRTSIAAVVGVDLPILLRGYAGYILSDSLETKYTGGSDTFKGTGMKVGVGLTFLPIISLNVEYALRTYKSASGTGFNSVTFDSSISKLEHSSVMVSVSAPLSF